MRFKSLDDLKKTKVGSLPINDSLFSVAPVENRKRERDTLSTLDPISNGQHYRKARVGYCVTIVSFRHKELDDDNLSTGIKPLRDAIATSLGIDDRDPRFTWEYRQVITRGAEGTLVEISTIELTHGKTVSKGAEAPTGPRE